jgi:hypothetical protein
MSAHPSDSRWTNPSVLRFAGESDPIAVVTGRARTLVMDAIQEGWEGPPFDPFRLAEFLKIPTLPLQDVVDARIVPKGTGLRIEFNPNRPRTRVRFSVAHEIAHTLFPDCAQDTRNRAALLEPEGDRWQLELLCNIAASEILMPTASGIDSDSPVTVDSLVKIQSKFDVSMEAVSIRLARATQDPCTVVVAARSSNEDGEVPYRVDYCVPSRTSPFDFPGGGEIGGSVFSQCTAVGYTAKGLGPTAAGSPQAYWECVGIPPYPGDIYPRVVGIARPIDPKDVSKNRLIRILGDALEPRGPGPHVVAQVVNDKAATWGAGFARMTRERYPSAQADFRDWVKKERKSLSLGRLHVSEVYRGLFIASMVAQHGYGKSDKPRIRYSALETCLNELCAFALQQHAAVQMPRIGTGYAGGNWSFISELLDECLVRKGVRVIVFALPGDEWTDPATMRAHRSTRMEERR